MANLFGISVNLLNQVVLVPLYLTYWSVDRYGDWIVLNALASLTILIALGINAGYFTVSFGIRNIFGESTLPHIVHADTKHKEIKSFFDHPVNFTLPVLI